MNSQYPQSGPRAEVARAIAQGNEFLRQRRPAKAIELGRKLAALHPGEPAVLAFLAEASRLGEDLPAAIGYIDQAIALGNDPQHRLKKAWLLSRSYRRDEAVLLAGELAREADGNGLLLWQLGKLYYHHNLLLEAVALYERALAIQDRTPWRYDLAVARFYAGQAEAAEQDIATLLASAPQAGAVLYLRSTLRRQTAERNHVADLKARLQQGFARAEDEACALYALGKELEDLGEHAESFASLLAGARKRRSTLDYDPSGFYATLEQIKEVATAEALAAPAEGCDEEGAIFVLGLPRTGTTLAERMLLQSGKVANAGELTDFGYLLGNGVARVVAANPGLSVAQASLQLDFATLGRDYMRGARQLAGGSPLFIDKLPPNFMYCGTIHKALPKARIIHLVRDPLDSCYAIFKTLFFGAYEFSYDLEELAEYYIAYRRLMEHWHEVLPGRILDVRYEDLVTDPEGQSRRIYDWCGLEWTPAALDVPDKGKVFATASAAQVREPVHSRSVRSSRRHLEGLAPLVERLKAAGYYQD